MSCTRYVSLHTLMHAVLSAHDIWVWQAWLSMRIKDCLGKIGRCVEQMGKCHDSMLSSRSMLCATI